MSTLVTKLEAKLSVIALAVYALISLFRQDIRFFGIGIAMVVIYFLGKILINHIFDELEKDKTIKKSKSN